MTNDERNQNDQMTKPGGRTDWRKSKLVIPSSLEIRHSSFLMVPAARSANCHPPGECNESDRAGDSGDPARIRSYPVSPDTRPSAAVAECACRRNVPSSRRGAHRARGAHRGPGFDATPMHLTDCPPDANENRLVILRAKFSLLSRSCGPVGPVRSNKTPAPRTDWLRAAFLSRSRSW